MVCVVIPAVNIKENNRQDLINLLDCLAPDREKYTKIIVAMDGIQRETEFYEYFTEKYNFCHFIVNELNPSGFSINANKGLRFVRDELRCGAFLVNQDTILPSYEYMIKVVGEGLSTPETIDLTGPDDGLDESEDKHDYLNELNKWYLEDDKIERKKLNNKFAFYCPYFSYELMCEVGLLDEDLKNLFSDDSYVLKTLLHGKLPIESVNVVIHHKGSHIDVSSPDWVSGSGTYGLNDLSAGLVQYKLKWSVDKNIEHANIIEWALKHFEWDENMRVL